MEMMNWFYIPPIYMWIVIGVYFIVSSIISYSVYKDAIHNTVNNPVFWVIIVFIFSVIGLLFYYLTRDPLTTLNVGSNKTSINTRNTSKENVKLTTKPAAIYSTTETIEYCTQCGIKIIKNTRYCPNCGSSLR